MIYNLKSRKANDWFSLRTTDVIKPVFKNPTNVVFQVIRLATTREIVTECQQLTIDVGESVVFSKLTNLGLSSCI